MPEVTGWETRVKNDGIYFAEPGGIDKAGAWRLRMGDKGPVFERCVANGWVAAEKWQEFNSVTKEVTRADKFEVTRVTSAYTVLSTDKGIECDASGAAFTVTLPTIASLPVGFGVGIGKSDSSANAVTIAANSANNIEGSSTMTLSTQWSGVWLVSDGDKKWYKGNMMTGGGTGTASELATVANGQTTVTVSHNSPTLPKANNILVTPINNLGNSSKWWISGITATAFVINVNADPGATTARFAWRII